MLIAPGKTARFLAFFQDSTTGLGVTGLTVAVNVNRGTTNAVSAGSATALDATNMPGVYYYDYAIPAGYEGIVIAYFSTATSSVSQRGLASLYVVSTFAADSVWNADVNSYITPGTMGRELKWG